jgi:hypothetical protein
MSLLQETEITLVPLSFLSKGGVRLQDVYLQSTIYWSGRRNIANKKRHTLDIVFEKCGNRKRWRARE